MDAEICSSTGNLSLSNIEEIGAGAFYGCKGFTSISLGNIKTIGSSAFENCIYVTDVLLSSSSLTSIGRGAFSGCTELTTVKSDNFVATLGDYAFSGDTKLSTIAITRYSTIGQRAFWNCSSLVYDDIINVTYNSTSGYSYSSNNTSVGQLAFYNCSGITKLYIPKTVTSIGAGAYSKFDNLTQLIVDAANTKYDSRNNCNAIIETSSNKLIIGCNITKIPSDVVEISDYAFYESSITSVTIPKSVTKIDTYAFNGCTSLSDVSCYAVTPPTVTSTSFSNYGTLHVLPGSVDSYSAATYWKNFTIVGDLTISATDITLNKTATSLLAGATETLTATVNPSDASQSVVWSSSNTSVATVSEAGIITAVAAGSATITCTAADGTGVSTSCSVTVIQPVTKITLSATTASLAENGTKTLTATVTPSTANNKSVTWSSSNTSVATVTSSGVVTAVAGGTATITCTAADGYGASATCAVTVTHSYSDGICSVCGSYQEPTLNNNYYEIDNPGKLYWFAKKVNSGSLINGKLTSNITLDSNKTWTPMGTSSYYFGGTFNGNNKTISGLKINSTTNYVGLFGFVRGTVENLILLNSSIISTGTGVGSICGYLKGNVKNCINYASVQGGNDTGGLIGCCANGNCVVEGCANYGVVKGSSRVGGIAGKLVIDDAEMRNCANYGSVTGSTEVGGIVGNLGYDDYSDITLENCFNSGTITGTAYVGGIIGELEEEDDDDATTIVENCCNIGSLTSTDNTEALGAIIGHDYGYGYTNVSNCYYDSRYQISYEDSESNFSNNVGKSSFAAGEISYCLNTNAGSTIFYQNLDNGGTVDSYPVLDNTHGTVYKIEKFSYYSNSAFVPATSVKIVSDGTETTVGSSISYTTNILPSNATVNTSSFKAKKISSVTWSSSNTSVATVSTAGVVTIKAAGTATIKCALNDGSGVTASTSITVKQQVTSISLSSTSLSLTKGKTSTLTATVTPSTANNTGVTWSSSNTAAATVSSSGVVTAVATGTATITCTAADGYGTKATCAVTVTNPVTNISLNNTSSTLWVGNTVTLSPTYTPSDADNRSVTWSTSNSSVATVSTSGVVTAKAKGTATITATSANGKTATCAITVKQQVTSISLSLTSATLVVDETYTITATASPSTATSTSVNWSTSDASVVAVSGGTITAKGKGTATITATAADGHGATATCTINVIARGDVNGDGSINTADITGDVKFILGESTTGLYEAAADYNNNGSVTTTDAISIVRLALTGTTTISSVKKRIMGLTKTTHALAVDDIAMNSGDLKDVAVKLNDNLDKFTSMQFDVTLPKGVTIERVSVGNRAVNHTAVYNKFEDGSVRVICYSLGNEDFSATEGDVVKFTLNADKTVLDGMYDVNFNNILLVRNDVSTVYSERESVSLTIGDATGVNAIASNNASISTQYANGTLVLTANTDGDALVYNASGSLVYKNHLTASQSVELNVPKGVYIVNGKKLLIK